MTLPVSPNSISMYQVSVELGTAGDTKRDFNNTGVRTLAEKTGDKTTISMSDLHGKANMPAQTYYLYTTPGTYSFTVPNGPYGLSGRAIGGDGGGGGGGGAGEWNWGASAGGAAGGSGGMGKETWFSVGIQPGDYFEIIVGGGGTGGTGGFGHWTGLGTSGGYFDGDSGSSGNAGGPSALYVRRNGTLIHNLGADSGGGGGGGAGGVHDNQNYVSPGGDGAAGWPGGNAGSSNSGKTGANGTSAPSVSTPTARTGTGTGGGGGSWGDEYLTGDTSQQPNASQPNNMFNANHRARISGKNGGNGANGRVEFTLHKLAQTGGTGIEHAYTDGGKYTPPATGGGGGGGGGGCVSVDAILPDGKFAGQIEVGNVMTLADHESLEESQGVVTMSKPTLQPGFRLQTESGASLVCSDTAPIPTRRGFVNPRDLLGMEVPVRHDMEDGSFTVGWEQIVLVHSVGDIMVQHITVGDKCFWAGEQAGSYILHHNLKEYYENAN